MAKIIGEGITFDDVLLVPHYSDIIPNEEDLSTNLTKNIRLNIPFISAGMDTVTEHQMAIAMARCGGIGIIHKNMSISEQAEEVDMVKRSENGVITDPFSLTKDHSLKDANDLMAKFRISGVPITEGKKLIAIFNKMDNKTEKPQPSGEVTPYIYISAKLKQNIDALETAIYEAADIPEINENSVIITSARHYEALTRADESILRVIDGMNMQLSGDLISEDLRICLDQLADITGGQITTHEVLGNIFQHFCIGK